MIRSLTWAERAVWGTCPVCGAGDRETCTNNIPNAQTVWEGWAWTHRARIDAAPKRVKMEGIE